MKRCMSRRTSRWRTASRVSRVCCTAMRTAPPRAARAAPAVISQGSTAGCGGSPDERVTWTVHVVRPHVRTGIRPATEDSLPTLTRTSYEAGGTFGTVTGEPSQAAWYAIAPVEASRTWTSTEADVGEVSARFPFAYPAIPRSKQPVRVGSHDGLM